MSESFELAICKPGRKLIVSLKEIDLTKASDNLIVIFVVEESLGLAGGRAAGYGSRKVGKIILFSSIQGIYSKVLEIDDEQMISKFEIPYSAVAMDIHMADGSSIVVQGIIDPQMIQSYTHLIEDLSQRHFYFSESPKR
ncbi:MAG TPA: hypothetical protein VF884_11195 [Nitrososphaeraceae archaeon]